LCALVQCPRSPQCAGATRRVLRCVRCGGQGSRCARCGAQGFRVVCAAAARGSRSVLRCVEPSGSPSLIAVEQSRPFLRCRVVHGDLGRRSPCAARRVPRCAGAAAAWFPISSPVCRTLRQPELDRRGAVAPFLRCRVVHGDLGRRSPCAARGESRCVRVRWPRGSRPVLRVYRTVPQPELDRRGAVAAFLRCRVVHGDLGRRSPCAARGELRLDLLHGDHPQHDAAVIASAVCRQRPAVLSGVSEAGRASVAARVGTARAGASERRASEGWDSECKGERASQRALGQRDLGQASGQRGASESFDERGSRGVGIARNVV
jgi:hypothetical protein